MEKRFLILKMSSFLSKIFCNCGSKKYDFMLLDLYNTGFNLLEIKERKCNYFSDFLMCDLSNMFMYSNRKLFNDSKLLEIHFYLRGMDKIKIGCYDSFFGDYEEFKDICDFSGRKNFIEEYKILI